MVNIAKERRDWNAVPGRPSIRRREQWGAIHNYTRARTISTPPATRIFIHISVTNPGNYRGNDAHAQAIERIGRARFGTSPSNTGISYNFGIMPNAALYEFQPVTRRGAHTVNNYGISTCTRSGTGCPGRGKSLTAPSGNLNYNARAYVICQNVNDPVTDAQIDKLARAIVCSYRAGFITRHAAHHPHGHRCVSSKSCPGERMWRRMWDLHTKIHYYLDHGLTTGTKPSPPEEEEDMPTAKEIAEELIKVRVPNRALGEEGATVQIGTLLSYLHEDAYQVNVRQPRIETKIDTLIDGQTGLDTAAIIQRVDERHDAADDQRRQLATQIGGISQLMSEFASGNLDEMQVIEGIRALIHEGTAPRD